jgi:hypothetical protein
MSSVPATTPRSTSSRSTNARLLRAAAAERMALLRERERLTRRRDGLAGQLATVEEQLATVSERIELIDRLAPEAANIHPLPAREERAGLKGAAIRRAAIEVLLARAATGGARQGAPGGGPIHYKDWYALLERAGHHVAGKDPLAVFLTQISRSPLVRRSTQAGVYELDLGAPTRLRERLARLHARLAEHAGRDASRVGQPGERAERERLLAELAATERALEEALRMLPADAAPDERAAAG